MITLCDRNLLVIKPLFQLTGRAFFSDVFLFSDAIYDRISTLAITKTAKTMAHDRTRNGNRESEIARTNYAH